MLVRDVMTSPAATVPMGTSVLEALMLVDERRVTSLPVIDEHGYLVGIVSEADLLRDAARHDSRPHWAGDGPVEAPPGRVDDVMSRPYMAVTGTTDLSDAVELMNSTAVKDLPVVKGGRVVGMLRRSDVVHLLACRDEHLAVRSTSFSAAQGWSAMSNVDGGVVTLQKPREHRPVADRPRTSPAP